MEKKTEWLIVFVLTLIIIWNVTLSININKLTKESNAEEYFNALDERLDDSMNFLAFSWMKYHNKSNFDWVDKLECEIYKDIPDMQINSINEDYVFISYLVDDNKYNVFYSGDGSMECFKKGIDIDCKEIFCE